MPRHRHQEWLKFLRLIDRRRPSTSSLHLIVDNYATHKHPEVQKWLACNAIRVPHALHARPAASWLNMVERLFRDITDKRIRRDSFTSVQELERPSIPTSPSTTSIPSHSSGPPAQRTSWPR